MKTVGTRTYGGQRSVDFIVQTEHVPTTVPLGRLADTNVEPLEHVGIVKLAVGTADTLVQNRSQ